MIAAISYESVVLYEILETTKEKVNSSKFQQYLLKLILLSPPEIIYYMDNCRIHHTTAVKGILHFYNIDFLFSSPYSPDYNPIELLFSFLKLRVKDYDELSIPEAIRKAVSEVTKEMIQGWIKKAVRHWISDEI